MTRRPRNFIALVVLALALPLLSGPASEAATSHSATWWPATQFGTSATERITRVLGSPGSSTFTALGTTTGAFAGKTSAGGVDAFIRRSDGTTSALRQYGTAGDDVPYDEYRNVEVGSTTGALPDHSNAGGTDGYAWAFGGGKTAWTTRLGTSGEDQVVGIAKGHKSLYVVGTTTGTFAGQTNLGGTDYFIARLDPANGAVAWVHQLGTAGDDRAVSISVTPEYVGLCCGWEDDITVTGDTTGTFPGQTSKGGRDLFTMTTGNSEGGGSLDQFGTSGDDVALAGSGNAVAGSTTGAFPGKTNRGGTDAFVASPDWAYQFGSTADDRATAISRARTPFGEYGAGFLVAGDTDGTLPGKSSAGGTDVFVLRVDRNGSALRWRFQAGSSAVDHAGGIASTSRGAIWGGQTFGSISGAAQHGGGDAVLGRVTWFRPDVAVGAYGINAGANVFGGPAVGFYLNGKTKKVWIRAFNDGEQLDPRRIVGCPSTSTFTVRYFASSTGREVTSKVLGTGLVVTPERFGFYGNVTMVLKQKPGLQPGATSRCRLRVFSTRRPAVYDDITLRVVR